jgi:vacuolar-type H+-ATPase subunit I/STV1
MNLFKQTSSKALVLHIHRLGILMLCFGIFLGCVMVGIKVLELKGQTTDEAAFGLALAGLWLMVLGLFVLQRKACNELISRL